MLITSWIHVLNFRRAAGEFSAKTETNQCGVLFEGITQVSKSFACVKHYAGESVESDKFHWIYQPPPTLYHRHTAERRESVVFAKMYRYACAICKLTAKNVASSTIVLFFVNKFPFLSPLFVHPFLLPSLQPLVSTLQDFPDISHHDNTRRGERYISANIYASWFVQLQIYHFAAAEPAERCVFEGECKKADCTTVLWGKSKAMWCVMVKWKTRSKALHYTRPLVCFTAYLTRFTRNVIGFWR